MKKLAGMMAVFLLCVAVMIMPCGAAKMTPTMDGTLDKAQVALGGVHPGDTMEQVMAIYGEAPKKESASHGMEVHSYEEGSFIITYEWKKVKNILCLGDGNKMTPDNVMMWEDESRLAEVYGMASQVEEHEDGRIAYVYWGNVTAPFQYIIFTTVNGSIAQISCGKEY